ncbi:hypothetical protein F4825DRAFT_427106 [Nemania diffusa]|nr:hypothetical protein F4825DRAFT_427106 [Nemania diffusa]
MSALIISRKPHSKSQDGLMARFSGTLEMPQLCHISYNTQHYFYTITSPKMQAIHAADEIPIINSFEQESNPDSSEAGTHPATPEPGQAGNWGSCGQPTPDTSPESIINVPSHRRKAPVCLDCQRDIGPVTTISSEMPSTEEIADATSTGRCAQYLIHSKHYEKIVDESDHCSHYSTDSEVSEEASTASCPEQEEISSLLASLRNSVISLFNLARQRNSRADARVQDTIRLIKSLPTIRRTRIKNPTRKLTPSQYKQLLEIIQDSEVFPDKLRFEYTHSIQQFEIRMTTRVHEGIVGELNKRFTLWQAELEKSNNPKISNVAKTLRSHGNEHLELPALKEAKDSKSPDGGILHDCKLACDYPALLFEIEFSHHTKEELKDKAKAYIERSNGKIRTVIGVYMGEIYKAERKNERRLKKIYRTSEMNESEAQAYATDEKNITGEASILVWRATIQKNNKVAIRRVQEQKFRGVTGKAIQSTLLRISLEECVCESDISSVRKSKTPLLEVSSESFCEIIKKDLEIYRRKRAKAIRQEVQEEKEKKRRKEEEARQREEERLRRAEEARIPGNVRVLGRVFNPVGRFHFSARNL